MKFRFRLLLWLSSLFAGALLVILGYWLPALMAAYGIDAFAEWEQPGALGYDKFRFGLITLGGLLSLSVSLLFLLGKKLSTTVYTGVFLLLVLISLLAGSVVATL